MLNKDSFLDPYCKTLVLICDVEKEETGDIPVKHVSGRGDDDVEVEDPEEEEEEAVVEYCSYYF